MRLRISSLLHVAFVLPVADDVDDVAVYLRFAKARKRAINPNPYSCKQSKENRDDAESQLSPKNNTPALHVIPIKNCVIWANVKYLACRISILG